MNAIRNWTVFAAAVVFVMTMGAGLALAQEPVDCAAECADMDDPEACEAECLELEGGAEAGGDEVDECDAAALECEEACEGADDAEACIGECVEDAGCQ